MNKKKVVALLVAGIMTLGVVGGTFAWFTSQDSITNVFNTGKSGDVSDVNAGIEVKENFVHPGNDGLLGTDDDIKAVEKNEPTGKDKIVTLNTQVLPGDIMKKEASVFSTANYDQFVRVRVSKIWRLAVAQGSLPERTIITKYKIDNGKIVYGTGDVSNGDGWTPLNNDKLNVTFAVPGINGDTWSSKTGGYYYYNQVLAKNGTTSDLLKSVKFESDNDDNYYKNLTFEVKVEAESIQASNGAARASGWDVTVPASSLNGY